MITKLPTEIKKLKYFTRTFMKLRCGQNLQREFIVESLDYEEMSAVASYGGFPKRYPHWTFGMEYYRMAKSYEYGLHKIYEMVINNDPIYVYLLDVNNYVDQKIVLAHSWAHGYFFENNFCFSRTNTKAVDMMANHASIIERLMDKYGESDVQDWIFNCLSLDNLSNKEPLAVRKAKDVAEISDKPWTGKLPVVGEYMDGFINPPEFVEGERKKFEANKQRKKDIHERGLIFPEEPEKDILGFFVEHAPLQDWQREVARIVREESYYFLPQARTKIMNEGWATYWHSWAMTNGLLTDQELIDYADHHSGVVSSHGMMFNPYRLGLKMWLDIEDRWNRGKHGKIYEECRDAVVLENWDLFVVFKNYFEDFSNDKEVLIKNWNEFLCFLRALKEGTLDIVPKSLYERGKILLRWDDYLNAGSKLAEVEKLDSHFSKEQDLANIQRRKSAREGDKHAEEHYEFDALLADKMRSHYRGLHQTLYSLKKLKEVFQKGKLSPEPFFIPDKFWTLASDPRYKGKISTVCGREKMFSVVKTHCDLTFIDEFLTQEIASELEMFVYVQKKIQGSGGSVLVQEVESRELKDVKEHLLRSLENAGSPDLRVTDANFHNANELYLKHYSNGYELSRNWAKKNLPYLHAFWQRPVHIEAFMMGKTRYISFDGEKITEGEVLI